MKCISLYQPYASMMVLGIKTLETRSFMTPKKYSGQLHIHASSKIPTSVYEKYVKDKQFRIYTNRAISETMHLQTGLSRPATFNPEFEFSLSSFRQYLLTGHILGTVNLIKSMPAFDILEDWKKADRFTDWEREWVVGDLSSDRFGWLTDSPNIWSSPVPAKGTISPMLWNPEPQIDKWRDSLKF